MNKSSALLEAYEEQLIQGTASSACRLAAR